MNGQVHIRNAEAVRKEINTWRRMLRADREGGLLKPEAPIEALYDKATGLPA